MPRALPWTDRNDQELLQLLQTPGATLRKVAVKIGVSRSFAQRRAIALQQVIRSKSMTRVREDAGSAPLPAGHPISWGALAPVALP